MAAQREQPRGREAVLAAAAEIVREEGPGALTLDLAAQRAGLSKGGLLYHFPNKDALIEAMITSSLDRFEQDVNELAEGEPPGPGRWLRAFVKVTFAADPAHIPAVSLLAAAAVNPALLEPVSRYFARWQERVSADGLDPGFAAIIRLASDGLWFADMFNAAPPRGTFRQSILEMLLSLIDEAERRHESR